MTGSRIVTLDNGYHIYTRTDGHGPIRLLCLHGGPGGNHEIFENFAEKLGKEQVTVTSYDQLGSWYSDQPDWSDPANVDHFLRLDYFVDELEEIRQKLAIDHFYLLGQSWGGVLTLEYALKYSEHLRGIIFSSMIDNIPEYVVHINELRDGMYGTDDLTFMKQAEASHDFQNSRYKKLIAELGERYLHRSNDVQPVHLVDTLATTVYNHFQGDNEFVVTGVLKDWDRRADIHELTVPTYLSFGEHETMPLAAARRMAKEIPKSRLHITPDSGHGQMLDAPESYFKGLGQFLSDVETNHF